MKTNRVRDLRHKEKFVVDDVYLNGYARHCGINATGVYITLCRHANNAQEAFPSIALIAEKLGISTRSVIRALQTLEKFNIIRVSKRKTQKGTYHPNLYILLDKSEWKPAHVTHSHANKDRPCDSQSPTNDYMSPIQVTYSHPKVKATIEGDSISKAPTKEFIDFAFNTFKNKYGEPLQIDGGKDGNLIKGLLETYSLEKLKGLWFSFLELADYDKFIREQAGVSIGVFKTQINKLLTRKGASAHKKQVIL